MSVVQPIIEIVQGCTFTQRFDCDMSALGIPNIQAFATGLNSFSVSVGDHGSFGFEQLCVGEVVCFANTIELQLTHRQTAALDIRQGRFRVVVSNGIDRFLAIEGRWFLHRGIQNDFAAMPTLSAPAFGNLYSTMHTGANGAGLGGRFKLDDPLRQVDLRMLVTVPDSPAVVRLFMQTFGVPGTLKLRICPGNTTDYQPRFTGITSTVFAAPAAGLLSTWVDIPIGVPEQIAMLANRPIHLVIEPNAGTWDMANYVEIISVRTRFPLHWQPGCLKQPERALSTFDRWFQVLYSLDSSATKNLLEERDQNAHYAPIAVIETLSGRFIGNPYDVHFGVDEPSSHVVFGPNRFGQVFTLERKTKINYLAIFGRGAGALLGVLPNGPLTIELLRIDLDGYISPVISPLTAVKTTDRRFLGRSHYSGAFLPDAVDLLPWPVQYVIYAASPGCSQAYAEDAWLVGSDLASNAAVQRASFGARRAYAVSSVDPETPPISLGVDADAPFFGLYMQVQSSIATMDEITRCETASQGVGVFSKRATPNEQVTYSPLVRNIGLDTTVGGAIFALIYNDDTGGLLATCTYPHFAPNEETAVTVTFNMLAAGDLHLRIESGHERNVGGGVADFVVDCVSYQTIRAT